MLKQLVERIPELPHTGVVLTQEHWISALSPEQNILLGQVDLEASIDWVVFTSNTFYDHALTYCGKTNKGVALLLPDLSELTPPRLKTLYEQNGVFVYKIVVVSISKKMHYFVILKNRCCIACKKKKVGCCPKLTEEQKAKLEAEHAEHEREEAKKMMLERFDFIDYLEEEY
jgi:hypothetical protein